MTRMYRTVGSLVETGRISKGEYVDFATARKRNNYRTNPAKTGCKPQILETDVMVNWVVHCVDTVQNGIWLRTENPVNSVSLSGITGYIYGAEELHNIVKNLYGVHARNMTDADVSLLTGYVPSTDVRRYAYYPHDAVVSGNIKHQEKMYIKKAHVFNMGRFYTSDGGGIEVKDENQIAYRVPAKNNPVFVSETHYSYKTGSFANKKVDAWLATPCVFPDSTNAYYGMRVIDDDHVGNEHLYFSYGDELKHTHPIWPVLYLDSTFQVNDEDKNRDGSTCERAWKVVI